MNVLAATPLYAPKPLVGAYLATHLFMRHLASEGHTVTAVATQAPGAGWTHEGIRVLTARRGLSHVRELARNADVIVTHFGHRADIARKADRPSVQMVHGHIYRGPVSADLLVFNSHASRDKCHRVGSSVVCPPPVNPDDHRVPSTGDEITIVNCSPAKGIRTVAECARRLPDMKFLGVLGGYDTQVRPSDVEIIAPQSDMRAVWGRTRVLLMPSKYETWGMVGVEAMCNGIPVIAHPTPGLQESLGDAGIWADRDDPDAWVDHLEALSDPVVYREASARATRRVAELDPRGSLERFTRAIEALA